MAFIPADLVGVFVGTLLGDSSLTVAVNNGNPRFALKQSIINFELLWTVFMLFSHFTAGLPYADMTTLKSTGITYLAVRFDTRAYPVLYLVRALFYLDNSRVKGISAELYHYLSPQALAYWIMCDGGYSNGGLVLCTDGFTVREVVMLINMLIIRHDLKCSLHTAAGLPRIYISRGSMAKLRQIVGPHMIPSFNYKLIGSRR